jgi:hypothetical protein
MIELTFSTFFGYIVAHTLLVIITLFLVRFLSDMKRRYD